MAAQPPQAHEHADPYLSFQFKIQVGDLEGYFIEIGGIGSENDVVTHQVTVEGRDYVEQIPGRQKQDPITLKRGITDNLDFWDWRQDVVDGKIPDVRQNGTITMYTRDYQEASAWEFINGWPSKVTGPDLKADSNDYGIEELTIVHEGLFRTK